MYDMHYDLLTAIYMAKLNNDFSDIKRWISYYNSNNVIGVVANMCFMSKEEMKLEYHENYYHENISVIKMFKDSVELTRSLIDQNIDIAYCIEGLDYLDNINDLKTLYNIGLRFINPVWNEPNKYGAGIRDSYGLTLEGRKLIDKSIELGIGIDLSHANEKTFDDIIDIVKLYKEKGINPFIYASHSNSRVLCDRVRNLNDSQVEKIKSMDGYIGIMSNRNFVVKGALEENIDIDILRKAYIKHIIYIGEKIGYDHILLSTDDMSFSGGDPDYQKLAIYNYKNIANELRNDLNKYFDKNIVDDIMFNNARKVLKK